MNIQWYPGHMTKARRMMQEDIKLIDIVIELVDARLPLASKNPDIDDLAKGKARLILLNKSDMADPKYTKLWEGYFKAKGFFVLQINARTGAGMKAVTGVVNEACKEKIERDRRRGIKNRPIRAMIVGIPNVGKSTFINSYAGKACTKTGNKPGVTKGKQWIKLNKNVELLDTPGILWPKLDDERTGILLAVTGAVKDNILDVETLACKLMEILYHHAPELLTERYKFELPHEDEEIDFLGYELLMRAGRKRGFLISGGEIDTERMARILLDEYRGGKLGRITLETPDEYAEEQANG